MTRETGGFEVASKITLVLQANRLVLLRPFKYKNGEKKGIDKSLVQPKMTADPYEILTTYQYFNYFLTDKMLEENAFENNQYHIQGHGEALKPQFFGQELEKVIDEILGWCPDYEILGWCPAGPVLPHGENVPL